MNQQRKGRLKGLGGSVENCPNAKIPRDRLLMHDQRRQSRGRKRRSSKGWCSKFRLKKKKNSWPTAMGSDDSTRGTG